MPGPYVPIGDAASHLGVSVSTIRKWMRDTHIPRTAYIKVGSTYRFDVAAIIAALTPVDTEATKLPDVDSVLDAVKPDALDTVLDDLDDDL